MQEASLLKKEYFLSRKSKIHATENQAQVYIVFNSWDFNKNTTPGHLAQTMPFLRRCFTCVQHAPKPWWLERLAQASFSLM